MVTKRTIILRLPKVVNENSKMLAIVLVVVNGRENTIHTGNNKRCNLEQDITK